MTECGAMTNNPKSCLVTCYCGLLGRPPTTNKTMTRDLETIIKAKKKVVGLVGKVGVLRLYGRN